MIALEDFATVEQMERLGGSFVKALANAARHADEANLARLKAAFPDYWTTYRRHAETAERKKGAREIPPPQFIAGQ